MHSFHRTSFIVSISLIINYLVPLVTFPLLVKTFDIELYGIWIEIGTLAALLSSFGSIGLGNALAMMITSTSTEDTNQIYSTALYTFLGVCGGLALSMWVSAPLLNGITTRSQVGAAVLQIIPVLVLTNSLNWLCVQVFRTRQRPLTFAVFDAGLSAAKVVAVFFAAVSRDLVSFALLYICLQSIVTLGQVVIAYRGIRLTRLAWLPIWRLLKLGTNLAVVGQANWVVMFGDRLLLSVFASSIAVAKYSASYQLTLILVALGSPYLYALLPILGERWKAGDIPGAQAAIRHSTRMIFIILIPAVFGLGFTGNALLRLLATEAFAQEGLLVGLIALGVSLDVLGTNLQYIFYVQNRPQILRQIYVRAAIFNIAANIIAIPLFSYYGAGIITLVTFALVIFLLWRASAMPLAALFDVNTLWRCVVASIVMGVWVAVTVAADIPHLLVAIVGGAVIYGVGIVLLRVVSIAELTGFLRVISRRSARS